MLDASPVLAPSPVAETAPLASVDEPACSLLVLIRVDVEWCSR
ncbi:hypothetical protein [Nannocystis pusilla]|nr:hypothetical protein [Nannocystis pusilla]